MALSHRLQWQKIGYLESARRFSSSFCSAFSSSKRTGILSQSKTSEAAKEQSTVAVEPSVKEYLQINPAVFPKTKQVDDKVGRSWYILKDIVNGLKEKVFSNSQIHRERPREKLDEMVDPVASHITVTGESLDTTDVDNLKCIDQPTESVTEPLHEKENSIISSHISEKKSSGVTVKSDDPLDCVKLVESLEGIEYKKNSSTVFAHFKKEKSSVAIVKSEDPSNCVKLVECRDKDNFEANSSTVLPQDKDYNTASMGLSFLGRELSIGEEKETKQLGFSGGATFVENGTSKEKESGEEKAIHLADLFKRRKMDSISSKKEISSEKDSSAHQISSDNLKESSGDNSMRKDIQVLINQIRLLNGQTPDIRFSDQIIDKSPKQVIFGTSKISALDKRKRSVNKHYIVNKLKQHVQEGATQMKKPKEKNLPHLVLLDKDKDILTRKNYDCLTNLVDDYEEDLTEKVPIETSSSKTLSYSDTKSSSNKEDFDYVKPKPSPTSPHLNNEEQQKRDVNLSLLTEKGRSLVKKEKSRNQTNLLVLFLLESVNITEVQRAFRDCGPIAEILFIPSKRETKFKDAYICFKTKEGMQKALAKTDVTVSGADVFVRSLDPSLSTPNKVFRPNMVEGLEVPTDLLENPTRTVMLNGLPQNLTSHHLSEAFSFCGGQITSLSMGASNSVAYVEFETEDAKEKAIAASSVTVSGKQIFVLRIDTPITTIIRISNVTLNTKDADIRTACSLLGQVKRAIRRSSDTFDVHFSIAEWPNMVKILNSLNGLVVNEQRWTVQPATVIPVEILQSVWNQQDGKRRVNSIIQNLLRKLGECPEGMAELNVLADQCYTGRS